MLVREVMTREPVTVAADASVKTALQLLDGHDVTALPVLNGTGTLVGVVSEADLVRDLLRPDPRLRESLTDDESEGLGHDIASAAGKPRRVEEVMTPRAVTVREDTDLALAIELITTTSIKSVPVVDGEGHVIGVVSRRDVVRVFARADDLLAAEVDAALHSVGLTDLWVEALDGSVHVNGPVSNPERVLARAMARTIPGVIDVHLD